ncbi:MAG: CoA-binding protein [Anaerolineales bacterium]|nr:CoA-binding protein [Anaerolineales bacterium]
MFERLFSPRGVVVIGASQNPTKLGYGVARNIVVSNYQGELYFVNPRGGRLFDQEIYPNVASVPDPLDLAVILIPAASVPGVLAECGERGIPYAIVGSGGFRETGEEGAALERQCLEIIERYGIRILGPNCIGFLDTHLPIDTTFLPLPGPTPGDIAFLSHSGAICEAVIDWARGHGFGISRLVSLGNQMDLTETDMLIPTAEDEHSKVLTMYLEGVGEGRTFIEQARKVAKKKPLVAIKVGKSDRGRVAVASHTGALAGEDKAFEAAFKKARVIRAQTSEEMFDWARALAWCPLPRGRRMAVLTNAGGPGAIAVDAFDSLGLIAADLSQATIDRMKPLLPSAASLKNPVDMLASAGPSEYANCLRALLADDGVDGVLVLLPPPPITTAAEVSGAIIPVVRSTSKPVVVALMGEELITHAAKLFRQSHVPDYRFPERAASALAVLAKRAEQLERKWELPEKPRGIHPSRVADCLAEAKTSESGFISSSVAGELVGYYGISTPMSRVVNSPESATEASESMGYPVALKVDSVDLPHKSDAGGVLLDLNDAPSVEHGYRELMERVAVSEPRIKVEDVMIQRMIPSGQEVIIGVVRDPQFGPLVMFGSGGVEVEELKDVAFCLAPLSEKEAEDMLEETWAGRKLHGFRGAPPADRQAVIDTLVRLGQLAIDVPQIEEIEVNPLRVFAKGEGVSALDVRIRVSGIRDQGKGNQ